MAQAGGDMTILSALSGLVGGIIGAVLTYWLGIRAEATKAHQKQRTDAYIEFVEAVAAVETSQRVFDQEKHDAALTKLIQAKAKIAIYGSRMVARALSCFLKEHDAIDSIEARHAFASIVSLMRSDSPNSAEPIELTDIELMLFPKS